METEMGKETDREKDLPRHRERLRRHRRHRRPPAGLRRHHRRRRPESRILLRHSPRCFHRYR
jgi:hypothetical protein